MLLFHKIKNISHTRSPDLPDTIQMSDMHCDDGGDYMYKGEHTCVEVLLWNFDRYVTHVNSDP